ncbi:hypothetical protein H6P81_017922 [Aristolochia fimbriata]|uniref:Amino acid transporter transmembrane domain-containing protein n=1 Tax=Aristolochia fimbriata TaxID=158543 RepID=A0AAV7E3U9_ARIFI|nr:hypothetical protein H6P81_017922 [Aristolochia fimbriata]
MMDETVEVISVPVTPRTGQWTPEVVSVPVTPRTAPRTPPTSAPPSLLHSPTLSRSPLLTSAPKTPRTPKFITPLASPMRKAVVTMRGYLEEVGHLTKLDPQDAWLPITESRNGNSFYSAFHTLSAGIGAQALLLPLAFTFLGWAWGIFSLSVAFVWQLYTLWILTQLHENSVDGTRHSRYLHLAQAAFGEKQGSWLAKFPTMYLSAGTSTTLIIIGGSSMKQFYQIICGQTCARSQPLTTIEWYLVFFCLALVLSQLPNLNSIAGVSLIGAVTAVGYCTLIWAVSVIKGRPPGVSYDPVKSKSDVARVFDMLNALGIVAFAFRGHNLTLEIQATMPSTLKHPSHIPMWKGVKFAYLLIASCLYPIAIGGYWAYGNLIPPTGILTALNIYHLQDTSKAILGLTSLLVVLNCLSTFQIYAMPVYDSMEAGYTSRKNRPCPWWLRAGFRVFFGAVAYLSAIAFPFLSGLAGLVGGIALPVTFAYPCFMWILLKKPMKNGAMWYINWGLGCLGMALSLLIVAGGVWSVVDSGLKVRFFKPE